MHCRCPARFLLFSLYIVRNNNDIIQFRVYKRVKRIFKISLPVHTYGINKSASTVFFVTFSSYINVQTTREIPADAVQKTRKKRHAYLHEQRDEPSQNGGDDHDYKRLNNRRPSTARHTRHNHKLIRTKCKHVNYCSTHKHNRARALSFLYTRAA